MNRVQGKRRADRRRRHQQATGKVRKVVLGTGIGLGTALAFASPAGAQDFTVTNLGPAGPGSLEDAVDQSNINPGADRILFQSGLTGQIDLSGQMFVYGQDLEIVGPGADKITLNAPGSTRAFGIFGQIVDPSEFGISGLTLKNGGCSYGGAILSYDTDLTISDSVLTENQSYVGGAVYSAGGGSLTVEDSTFSGNTAQIGGAITSANPVTVGSSTFSGNRARSGGGAIVAYPTEEDVSLSIVNSTFSRNGSGLFGGAIGTIAGDGPESTLNLASSTISGNQAGIAGGGISGGFATARVENSVIENNFAFYGPDVYGGTFTGGPSSRGDDCGCYPDSPFDTDFSFIGDTSGATINTITAGSNILNGGDALLGRLANNGGPTQTMAAGPDSPVVNKGSSVLTGDQRGLTRPVTYPGIANSAAAGANGADMGAFELQYTAPPPPPPPPPPTPPIVDRPFRILNGSPNRGTGVSTIGVEIPAAGTVEVLGYKSLKSTKVHFDAKGTYKVKAVPKGKFKKKLNKAGRARHIVRFVYTPDAGRRLAKSKVFAFFKGAKSGKAKAAGLREWRSLRTFGR